MCRNAILLLFAATIAHGADGDVDLTFGSAGNIVLAPVDASPAAYAAAVQPDGRILVGGTRWAFGQDPGLNQAAIWRFLPDGVPDLTFGDGGLSATAFGQTIPFVFSVLPLPDGDILAAANLGAFGLMRLHEDGRPDAQFGDNGVVIVDFSDLQVVNAVAHAVAVDSQGRILVAGGGHVIDETTTYWNAGTVARLLASGQPDPEFGNLGRVVYRAGTAEAPRSAIFLGIQSDAMDRVWLSGHLNAASNSPTMSFLAARLNQTGAFDSTFGSDGVFASNLAPDSDDWGNNGVLDHDSWTIGGTCDSMSSSAALCALRLDGNGMPDPSYGSNGWATAPVGGASMRPGSVACQSDSKCLVLGTARSPTTSLRQFVVTRLDTSGGLDETFGIDGISRIDVPISGDGSHVTARSIAIQAGRPVLAGTTDGVPYVNALFTTRLENDLVFSSHFD